MSKFKLLINLFLLCCALPWVSSTSCQTYFNTPPVLVTCTLAAARETCKNADSIFMNVPTPIFRSNFACLSVSLSFVGKAVALGGCIPSDFNLCKLPFKPEYQNPAAQACDFKPGRDGGKGGQGGDGGHGKSIGNSVYTIPGYVQCLVLCINLFFIYTQYI
ncbi:maker408 [Drosophila busckii]|uniref:Maker408 n=1 Tax=Drosophila busckii TaxID=30019 RepID=A0A0M5J8T7_DROBS|nr:maker408 [Drosophila busckii]